MIKTKRKTKIRIKKKMLQIWEHIRYYVCANSHRSNLIGNVAVINILWLILPLDDVILP